MPIFIHFFTSFFTSTIEDFVDDDTIDKILAYIKPFPPSNSRFKEKVETLSTIYLDMAEYPAALQYAEKAMDIQTWIQLNATWKRSKKLWKVNLKKEYDNF
jgi:hypothetical protein